MASLGKPQARRALATSRVVQVHAVARYAFPHLCPREMPPRALQRQGGVSAVSWRMEDGCRRLQRPAASHHPPPPLRTARCTPEKTSRRPCLTLLPRRAPSQRGDQHGQGTGGRGAVLAGRQGGRHRVRVRLHRAGAGCVHTHLPQSPVRPLNWTARVTERAACHMRVLDLVLDWQWTAAQMSLRGGVL